MARKELWPPPGTVTQLCPLCHGTGADQRMLQAALVGSRVPVTDTTGLRCRMCDGRGRIVDSRQPKEAH